MEISSVLLLGFISAYLLINLVVFAMYGWDKRNAVKGEHRISETRLLTAALLGPFGAWTAMRLFHHKTRKTLFKLVPLFVILHLLLLILYYF
ncbi:MAG TPA: DUF1294 domain-containing protein [Methanomassiliicoccales archaeon]|nr:DUF1294 domain-containing protein [Methanomassiliicoccales archaeon]